MPHSRQAGSFHHCQHKQHGAVLMVMLVIMIIGSAAFLVSSLSRSALQIERDKKTSAALEQAKEALIGYAASVNLTGACANSSSVTCPRPGDLPCPDTNNDGVQETSCGSGSGSNQAQRLGRLPWKTLGLPDLRDGSGERLWYAVSNNFKQNFRTTCYNANLASCLNSDTPGTISVFASDGALLNNGGAGTGAAAVVIAPGDVLQRTDKITPQDRSSAGINNPQNYLDIALGEDNANFADVSSTNGFIQGRIKDGSGKVILNDQLLVITQDNIMLPLQKRVAAEVKNCLAEYAAIPQNNNYYPWATARTLDTSVWPNKYVYNDSDNWEFGRVPDQPFNDTRNDSCNATFGCDLWDPSEGMKDTWGPTCTLTISNWWVNWKEMVFYGLTYYQRPHNLGHTHDCTTNACLVVNPPSAATDKPFVVIVAGKKIGSQVRLSDTHKNTFANYLEGLNSDSTSPFEKSSLSSTYNDWVVFP